jgi:di/tricarboxylate transporter
MAAQLNAQGFIGWMSGSVVDAISGLGLTWQPAFAIITVIYFYSHYFFASDAAHIGAMYRVFGGCAGVRHARDVGGPAARPIEQRMSCLTTYGIGSAPPYFGAGYVAQADWLKLGFVLSVYYLAVWGGCAMTVWKAVGIW